MSGLSDGVVQRLRERLTLPARVAERYVPEGLIGRGGMGEVYRARDEQLGRTVALKVLATDAGRGAEAERLRQEARVLARLEHPGVVPVHDAGVLEDGRTFYVMRFVEGHALDARGSATRGDRLRLVLRIAETMAFAHRRGVVHRDLKPANVMIGPFGEVMVLDWGVAKVLGPEAPRDGARIRTPGGTLRPYERGITPVEEGTPLTAAGATVGTPGYMAPEQARGEDVDARADIHALGVILREALEADGAPVPKPLASVVARATAPDREARYPSMEAFGADVRRWLDGEAVLAHREGPMERVGRFLRRHQAAILLLVAYAAIRLVILFWRGV